MQLSYGRLLLKKNQYTVDLEVCKLISIILLRREIEVRKLNTGHNEYLALTERNLIESCNRRLINRDWKMELMFDSNFYNLLSERLTFEADFDLRNIIKELIGLLDILKKLLAEITSNIKQKEQDNKDQPKIDIIGLLIESNDQEGLKQIFMSGYFSDYEKAELYKRILVSAEEEYKNHRLLDKVFRSNASLEAVFKSIRESTIDFNTIDFCQMISRKNSENVNKGNRKIQIYLENKALNRIVFLLDRCDVNPNQYDTLNINAVRLMGINISEDIEVSSAAKAYESDNFIIGNYLYGKVPKTAIPLAIRRNSDMVIMKKLADNKGVKGIIEFMSSPNFTFDVVNLTTLMYVIMTYQTINSKFLTKEELYSIYASFIDNTSIEEKEDMERALEIFVETVNPDALKDARKRLTLQLRRVSLKKEDK